MNHHHRNWMQNWANKPNHTSLPAAASTYRHPPGTPYTAMNSASMGMGLDSLDNGAGTGRSSA